MPEYRRWFVPGGTYFFTLVTYKRRPILCTDLGRRCLREAIEKIKKHWPFDLFAIVLLPDHLHTIWTLPPGDSLYPIRWKRIKEEFTRQYLNEGGLEVAADLSRLRRSERGIWQRRYWEHTVRDDNDLKRCVDYIHWNPRKHAHVNSIRQWQWSSFHRFVTEGEYEIEWGGVDPTPDYNAPEWGE